MEQMMSFDLCQGWNSSGILKLSCYAGPFFQRKQTDQGLYTQYSQSKRRLYIYYEF